MNILPYKMAYKPGDVDPTYNERHYLTDIEPNYLKTNFIHKVQERFCELGFEYMIGNINGCYNAKLASAVAAFQEQALSGERTCIEPLNGELIRKQVLPTFVGEVTGNLDVVTLKEINTWLKNNFINNCPCRLLKLGRTWVQPSMMAALNAVTNEVNLNQAYLPDSSFACFRSPANKTISSGMISKSLHNLALAVDLDEWRGMQDPLFDKYFIESSADGEYWEVFIRSASDILPESVRTFKYYNSADKTFNDKEIKGRFVNLSEIFKNNGLVPIKRKKGWEDDYYLCEWWHFQKMTIDDWSVEIKRIGYTDKALALLGK